MTHDEAHARLMARKPGVTPIPPAQKRVMVWLDARRIASDPASVEKLRARNPAAIGLYFDDGKQDETAIADFAAVARSLGVDAMLEVRTDAADRAVRLAEIEAEAARSGLTFTEREVRDTTERAKEAPSGRQEPAASR